MNLTEQRITGNDQIYLSDALNASLLELKLQKVVNTISPDTKDLKIYIDKQSKNNPSTERREYVFSLNNILNSYTESELLFHSDAFTIKIVVENNDIIMKTKVIRKIGIDNNESAYLLDASVIEEINSYPIILFEGENYIYTNYNGIDIELVYAKDTDENKMILNSAIYYSHKMNNTGDFSLDNIYFKDAFTKTNDKLNLDIDSINISCLTSKNNKFSLDEDGNLVVNSITFNENNISNTSIYDQIYPVGSIYLSVNSTNPTNLFGGAWTQLKDKFLLGAGDTYVNGDVGGEATHILTVDEMPSHGHKQRIGTGSGTWGSNFAVVNGVSPSTVVNTNAYNTGGSQPHNNMPPYLVIYMWQRIA